MVDVLQLDRETVTSHIDDLIEVLCDATNSGASVGFLAPLEIGEARAYWQEVIAALPDRNRILLAAKKDGRQVGTVQLHLATKPNSRHRAEVIKLLVHRSARRQGIGRTLMLAVEKAARAKRRTLLVLDTRRGDFAERLYLSMGYRAAGVIPRCTLSSEGTLDDTVVMYREIGL